MNSGVRRQDSPGRSQPMGPHGFTPMKSAAGPSEWPAWPEVAAVLAAVAGLPLFHQQRIRRTSHET